MKIETEVDNSLYAFTSAEGKCGGAGGTGCSMSGGELPPIAQDSERSSIDHPERQPTLPGCGGCGPGSAAAENNGCDVPITSRDISLTSVFDCEHFQFIDEEEEEEATVTDRDVPATETSMGGKAAAAPATDSSAAAIANGTPSNGVLPPPRYRTITGSHLSSDHEDLNSQQSPEEVSALLAQQARDTDMSDSETAARSKGHAVKRQVSFDDAVSDDSSRESVLLKKELRSVLKKSSKSNKKHKGRVTFDESVTLYSDDNEEVQLLALTTGPDISCTEVFYMFEPPIEYQDVPPFEPPAEYRDSDDVSVSTPPTVAENHADQSTQQKEEENHLQNGTLSECCSAETVVSSVLIDQPKESSTSEPIRSDVAVSKETENNDCATDANVTDSSEQEVIESTEESDKLFERFLEAEREFAVDEELNSVFHALENDFTNDDKNGALDDNFFRKLINLLSSAEGDAHMEAGNYFSSTNFTIPEDDIGRETEDDDNSQTHSRTLSEADSDCSISSQDTIIVRFGEDDSEQNSTEVNKQLSDKCVDDDQQLITPEKSVVLKETQESYDEVFSEMCNSALSIDEKPKPLPRESLLTKNNQVSQAVAKIEKMNGESLSRQSSGEQSVNSGNSQDPPQDADDSTSSDSRSGEVEEEIRLDDIGYDEEDADDYDEESFRGMAHGNSKIRRIIKKNALQCTLFRGIEAKRRQQPGAKYPRPKSPLLSQESLVEKLKWLTTIDEHKDVEGPLNFHSKPPDVILSTGGVPVNGSIPHSASSEDDIGNQSALNYQQPPFYQMQQRHILPPNGKAGYYARHDYPPIHHPSLPRQRMMFPGHPNQMMSHILPYSQNRVLAHPAATQPQWSDQQRPMTSMTVPRNFRDWRVIQRVTGIRSNEGVSRSHIPADYVRAPNGGASAYHSNVPPDVSRTSQPASDELEQFVEQDCKRIERIKKRYSLAEEDDDPTFGFARRPSVRGVQSRIQSNPSDTIQGHGTNKVDPYVAYEESAQGPSSVHTRPATAYSAEQMRVWNRDPNWRPDGVNQSPHYGPPPQAGRSQVPMHIHRASVALTELPGNATIPYTHRKPHLDMRYHSYAESMYGSTRTLPTKGWIPPDPRSCHSVTNSVAAQTLQMSNMPPVSPPMLQVPPHPIATKDERGVPEGASSSPKISQDSLYHAPVPDSIATGGPHKDDGVIYYSLNV